MANSSIQTQILNDVQEIKSIVTELQLCEASRKERDKGNDELLSSIKGNGKPGWNAIRDKVISWEGRGNTLFLLVIGDIVMRIIQNLKAP